MLHKYDKKSDLLNEKLKILKEISHKYQLNRYMRSKLKRALVFLVESKAEEKNAFLNELPSHLR